MPGRVRAVVHADRCELVLITVKPSSACLLLDVLQRHTNTELTLHDDKETSENLHAF